MSSIFHSIQNVLWTNGYVCVKSMPKLGRSRLIDVHHKDHVRLSSLELVADEIYTRGLAGNVAEVGVFQGDFAQQVNRLFPDRKLYLFDTFEGFDERDSQVDRQNGYSRADGRFPTSVELVLNKMAHPTQCIIKKGWFPESAAGVEDQFVFVSLDVDLYQAISSGLEFFYPRLVRNGFIFVHDFNNTNYRGVKPAVREFCSRQGIGYFPLTDESGSAVIIK